MSAKEGTAAEALKEREKIEQLMRCCQDGSLQTFKKATKDERFRANADALRDVRDEYGRSLLHQAAQMGHVALCEHMLEKLGFDVNDQDKTGETPLTLACATNKPKVLSLLLSKGACVARRREPGGTAAIHRAAGTEGGLECLAMVLEAGADPSTPSDTGSPLGWAAGAGLVDSVKLLLSKGAAPNDSAPDEVSALSMATMAGSPETVAVLLKAGADPNTIIKGGATALHVAAVASNQPAAAKIISMLLEAGANPNAKDREGHTPLMIAALSDHQELSKLLLPKTEPIPEVQPWNVGTLAAWAKQKAKDMEHAASSGKLPDSTSVTSQSGQEQLKVAVPVAEEPDKEKAMQHKRQGDEAFVKQDYETSYQAYSSSLRHDTSSAAVWANRAAALLRLGRAPEALEDARRSRAVDPSFVKAWYREGSAYAAMKLWEDAACAYFEGCQLAPGNKDFEAAFKSAIDEGRKEFQAQRAKK